VADEPIASSGTGDDDVARLVALTDRQHELWDLLRDTKDEQVRNRLLDELTTNREELTRLKIRVSSVVDQPRTVPRVFAPRPDTPDADNDQPRSVGEQLRSSLLGPDTGQVVAPAQPPPPPPSATPSQRATEPDSEQRVAQHQREPEGAIAEPQPEPVTPETEREPPVAAPQPGSVGSDPDPVGSGPGVVLPPGYTPAASEPVDDPPVSVSDHVEPGLLLPEKTPFRSREDDLAATQARRETSAVKPPIEPPATEPDEIDVLERRRQIAHDTIRDMDKMRPHSRPRSRVFPVVAIVFALGAVAAAAWYLFIFDRGSDQSTPNTATTTTLADVGVDKPVADQIQAVVGGMGLAGVTVEERDGIVYLSGSVDSEADRSAAIGAAEALAGSTPVDGSGLTVAILDEDLRLAALDAITAANFDKVNVSVVGGVATLTGVTPEGGPAELIDMVRAVDGITQVVDMTETADRAAALAIELDRVTAVTPMIFESGQVSLNPLQERILDSAAEIILAYDGPIVTIVSYTDAAGTAAENERISLQRAERVQDYLIEQGVAAERLAVDARGEAGSTGSESVAGLERRVEFEVGYAVAAGGNAGFRIGIVAPSAANDLAFTQSIVDAANVIASERGSVGIDISDGLFVTADAEAAIRSYAADGYDLVIAHGSQYGQSLAAIAPEFPNVAFAWGTAADTFSLPNVSAYEVAADQGGYVMGTIAAQLTESGVIGVVGPLEVGDAALYINGFTAGVETTDPQVEVLTTYIGSFSDLGLAAETAESHVTAGADVLTGSAQMIVGAVGVATENDALWMGNQANQTELAPDLVVASQVYHWEVALRQIIDGIDQGVPGGETYTLTLANGGIVIEYNPAYSLAAEILSAANAVTAGIIDGSVTTGQ
jgi:basic membrane protein A